MRVPFPHVEQAVMVSRPAVVLTPHLLGGDAALTWVLMITNARRPVWCGDVPIPDAESIGLLIPSKVRTAKIATVSATLATRLGRLADTTWDQVTEQVRRALPG